MPNNSGSYVYNSGTWSGPVDTGLFGASPPSCTSSTFCVAVDLDGNVATYNGTSWSAPAAIDPGVVLNAVSCASSTFCVAIDDAPDTR